MGFRKVITTEEAIANATTHLAEDITALSARKDNALSTFRRTANELAAINDGLRIKQGNLQELAAFIQEQENATSKMMADNDAVRSRILEIIGE